MVDLPALPGLVVLLVYFCIKSGIGCSFSLLICCSRFSLILVSNEPFLLFSWPSSCELERNYSSIFICNVHIHSCVLWWILCELVSIARGSARVRAVAVFPLNSFKQRISSLTRAINHEQRKAFYDQFYSIGDEFHGRFSSFTTVGSFICVLLLKNRERVFLDVEFFLFPGTTKKETAVRTLWHRLC